MSLVTVYRNTTRISRYIFRTAATVLVDTWLDAFMNKPSQNMNPYVRWELFIIGCLFLGITMNVDTQLHWLVLLPLMSIYLIQAAIIGYEPLYFLIQRAGAYLHKHSYIQRLQTMGDIATPSPDNTLSA